MLYNDTARLGTSNVLVKAIEKLEKLFEEITRPVLLLHGEDDIITSPQMSKALFERCGSQDKTLKLYPKQRHALLFEGVAEQCFADIVAWLDQRAL